MGKSSTALAVYLLIHYGIIDASPCEIHIPSPSEVVDREKDKDRSDQDKERDSKIIDDPNASDKDKEDAFNRMVDNHEIA